MSYQTPKKVPSLGFYYHYKHDPNGPVNQHAYEIIGVGFHTEENARQGEEHFLIYRPLYNAFIYKEAQTLNIPCFDSRPLEMWMEDVEKDGKKFPRFQKITDPSIIDQLEKIKSEMYP